MAWNVYIAFNDHGIIEGEVRDRAGAPVAGATVIFFERNFIYYEEKQRTATDAQGVYRFTDMKTHIGQLEARTADGRKSERRQLRLWFRSQDTEVRGHVRYATGQTRVQQMADALERHIGAGDRDDAVADPALPGLEQRGVHPERDHVELVCADGEILGDVDGRGRRHGDQLRELTRHVLLHLGEAVPPTHQRFAPPGGGRDVEYPVPGDRVVNGGHHRQTRRRDLQQPGAQALVVVNDIEVVAPLGQQPRGAQTEGLGLREAGRPGGEQLQQVDAGLDLVGHRDAERVRLAVKIEAGHLRQPDAGVEHFGVGLTGEDFDVVPELYQPAAQVPDVDSLATAVGLAPIGQQGDAHAQLTYPAWRANALIQERQPP